MAVLLAGAAFFAHGDGGYDAPYFQADFTQDLTDWSSALVNPALLYRVNQMHVDALGIYLWALGDDALGYQHMAFQYPIRRNQTLGLTMLFSRSSIQKIVVDSLNRSFMADGNTSFQDVWFMANYGIRILPWLMLGTNVKIRAQYQFGEWAGSHIPGIDLGVYFNPLDHYRFGDLGISLCLQDVLPTQVSWGEAYNTTGLMEELTEVTASRLRFGVRYSALNDNLVGDVEFLIDNALGKLYEAVDWKSYVNMFMGRDSANTKKGAIPLAYRFGAHVKYMFIPQIWLKAGWTNNNIPYLGFNANLIYPLPEMINYVNLDCHLGYSFIETLLKDSDKKDERGFTVAMKLSTDFGPTREQRESKRLYDKLILAPMDAYNEAMRLYLAGKYWEASFAFGKVLSLFPNFHLNDKATYYLGNCYRFLYMNDISRQVYKDALEEYTTSEMRSKYLYGLMALDYREGKLEDALKNHSFIINLYADSDIRPDADYLAGEIHFQQKNYNVAEQLFSSIPQGDPHYLYSQYTLSIINVENGREQAAIQNLTNVINDTTQQAPDQMLQDAANLKLGHLYFESGDKLRLAVEAYQRVPDGSTYQDEALLGTAWAWIKVNQPNVAIQTIDKLVGLYGQSPLVPEAYLVKGYAMMLSKRYPEAASALEQCLDACKRTFVTEEDLKNKKESFDQFTVQFTPTAENIKKNALRKPTNKTLEERPELQKLFDGYASESKEFFDYTLLEKSHTRFFKRKEEILSDAEYALVKTERMMGAKKTNAIIEKTKDKEEKIDNELEKLKDELNNFEE
ncbi:MAG TPA: tetratricopeptide repeat protein [Chitinispirillaceae bacterium]|nr:tetratricopeptide repeat protein [Chitinispirillaceae bacterium]